jgi:hypothetical protein
VRLQRLDEAPVRLAASATVLKPYGVSLQNGPGVVAEPYTKTILV